MPWSVWKLAAARYTTCSTPTDMLLVWDENAWQDYLWWQQQDRRILRRITDEHRLVYKVTDGEVRIATCRYHYG